MNNNMHCPPDYESPPRKRRRSELHDNAETRAWLLSYGVSPTNDEVTARTPRKPKVPCVGFNVDSGVPCGERVHQRSDTDGFPVCLKHAGRKCILALHIHARFMASDFKDEVAARAGDPGIFRKASGHLARTALNGSRSRRPGFFYMFERTDVSAPVVKFGVDFADFDDDVESRIVTHETSSCMAELNHYAVSQHFANAGMFDHVVNMLLAPVQVAITCPCGVHHKGYFALEQYTLKVGTGLWGLFRELSHIVEARVKN